jgi:hypothetical protein
VSFDGRTVTICHMRLLGQLTAGRGEKRVPLSSIAAVEWNPTWNLGWFSDIGGRGFIRFTIPGGIEQRGRPGWEHKERCEMRTQLLSLTPNNLISSGCGTLSSPPSPGGGSSHGVWRKLAR